MLDGAGGAHRRCDAGREASGLQCGKASRRRFRCRALVACGGFAEGLIRGAAVLGVDRVGERGDRLAEWRACATMSVLSDRRVDNGGRTRTCLGVRVEVLPASFEGLPAWLPMRATPPGDFSRTLVAVEAETQPALFRLDPTRVERCRITPAANIDAICRRCRPKRGSG